MNGNYYVKNKDKNVNDCLHIIEVKESGRDVNLKFYHELNINSLTDWKDYLKDKHIIDGCGTALDHAEFMLLLSRVHEEMTSTRDIRDRLQKIEKTLEESLAEYKRLIKLYEATGYQKTKENYKRLQSGGVTIRTASKQLLIFHLRWYRRDLKTIVANNELKTKIDYIDKVLSELGTHY